MAFISNWIVSKKLNYSYLIEFKNAERLREVCFCALGRHYGQKEKDQLVLYVGKSRKCRRDAAVSKFVFPFLPAHSAITGSTPDGFRVTDRGDSYGYFSPGCTRGPFLSACLSSDRCIRG